MEAFDLAVGLRTPGPGPAGADAQVAAGVAPGVLAVGPGVVGQDPFDADAQGREVGGGPHEEGCAGRGGLVGKVFGVGNAAVVVECGVEVGVSGAVASVLVRAACCPAEDFVAAAVGNPAQLLDVDVDQFAGSGAFVAADGLAGRTVQGGQGRLAVSLEDAVSGRGRDVAPDGQPERAYAVFAPEAEDFRLDFGRCPSGLVVGPAGAVTHSGDAELPVAGGPSGGGGVADLETLRCPAQRPSVLDDTAGQAKTPGLGQRGVTVDHEGLLGSVQMSQSTPNPEALTSFKNPARVSPTSPDNPSRRPRRNWSS